MSRQSWLMDLPVRHFPNRPDDGANSTFLREMSERKGRARPSSEICPMKVLERNQPFQYFFRCFRWALSVRIVVEGSIMVRGLRSVKKSHDH